MATTIQRTDYTKNGYGKKILLDLINSPMEKSRAYYNNIFRAVNQVLRAIFCIFFIFYINTRIICAII